MCIPISSPLLDDITVAPKNPGHGPNCQVRSNFLQAKYKSISMDTSRKESARNNTVVNMVEEGSATYGPQARSIPQRHFIWLTELKGCCGISVARGLCVFAAGAFAQAVRKSGGGSTTEWGVVTMAVALTPVVMVWAEFETVYAQS